MKRLAALLLLVIGLLAGATSAVQAQRGYARGQGNYLGRGYYGRPAPRRYYRAPAYRRSYGPRYYHGAPYRSYGGRYYYRPRPARIIRP